MGILDRMYKNSRKRAIRNAILARLEGVESCTQRDLVAFVQKCFMPDDSQVLSVVLEMVSEDEIEIDVERCEKHKDDVYYKREIPEGLYEN